MKVPSIMMICQTTPCFVLVMTALMEFATPASPFSHTGDAHCKTSWGLPITAGNDSLNYSENDNAVILSEQQLLENPGSYGDQAYDGGLLDNTVKYAKDVGGLNSGCAFLYILNHWSCQNSAVLIRMLIALLGTLLATHATQEFSEQRRVYPCEQNHLRGTEPGTQTCVRLRDEKSRHKRRNQWLSPAVVALVLAGVSSSTKAQNLRPDIKKGNAPCFQHIPEEKLFILNCSILNWLDQGYVTSHAIELGPNEVFDGTGGIINLSGVQSFAGLFWVNRQVQSFTEAPVIKHVHVKNGTTFGGFIVRDSQSFFSVDSCSSTGDIFAQGTGGICGSKAGQNNGHVQISNSYSTGRIKYKESGGITGKSLGYNGGFVNITRCYSTGNIEWSPPPRGDSSNAGGICGMKAGEGGTVYVTETYSTGDILDGADGAGGIMGGSAGSDGKIYIQRCYSTGQISAPDSGGITGKDASQESGELHIVDCYSRGNVSGTNAGGITGAATGGVFISFGDYGNVFISRVYASGSLHLASTGGIIGSIYTTKRIAFRGSILVERSVYNGKKILGIDKDTQELTGGGPGTIKFEANSGNLGEIRGELYERNGTQYLDDGTWTVHGADELPILLFQLGETTGDNGQTPTNSDSASPSPTPPVTSSSSDSSTISSGTAAALATSIIVVFLLGVALVIFWRYRISRSTNSTDNPDQTSSTVNDGSSTSDAGEADSANKTTQNTRSKVEVSEV